MKTIELKIEKSAYGGYGLGFHEGKVCFVPYAVPGDEAVVEIYKDKRDYSFGRIIEVKCGIVPKINPACPNFGICGGCSYLNIPYEHELSIKKDILIDSLSRIAGIAPGDMPEISVIKGGRFNYRSHASVKRNKEGVGFFMRESNKIVSFPEGGCSLLAEPLNDRLSRNIRIDRGDFRIACSHDGIVSLNDGNRTIREIEMDIVYERDIELFFQANRFLRKEMLNTAAGYAALTGGDTFLDIGCGVGFFALRLACAKCGCGIDMNAESVKWAAHNAQLNGISNISFEAKSASEAVSCGSGFSAVVLDPPRAGLDKASREALKALSPGRIVYVSCNPSTFARDARDILSCNYSLDKLTLIDMFPATHHIEVISLFSMKK